MCWPNYVVDRGPPWGHLGISMTLDKVHWRYCWLQASSASNVQPFMGRLEPGIGQMHQYNVRDQFKMIAVDVSVPFIWSNQGNWYLLIATNCIAKLLEVLITNFCRFGVPWELHGDEGHLMQEGLKCLAVNKMCTPPLFAVRWQGGMVHKNRAFARGHRVAPEGLECEITHLLPWLQGIRPWQDGFNATEPSVRKRNPIVLWPAVWDATTRNGPQSITWQT